jgi:guanylate kinase
MPDPTPDLTQDQRQGQTQDYTQAQTADEDHRFHFFRQGILFILSAPSGAGKTTLADRLLEQVPHLSESISYTTRPPRTGEISGQDYHFVTEDDFIRLRDADAFAEWAEVHDALYGTAHVSLTEALDRGQDILLNIDVQGAQQIKAAYPHAVTIFILPPSWPELENRLCGRGTDSAATIAKRLKRARTEASQLFAYDYYVVNELLEQAVTELHAIMLAEHARVARLPQAETRQTLLAEAVGQKRP